MTSSYDTRGISDRQRQAGIDWLNLKEKRKNMAQQRVLNFLKDNPMSTADEIFSATKGCISDVRPRYIIILKGRKPWRYKVNIKAMMNPR